MQFPQCHSDQIIKNGSIHNSKPKYLCKACRRQFVEDHRIAVFPMQSKP
jgi:transposase-like protein